MPPFLSVSLSSLMAARAALWMSPCWSKVSYIYCFRSECFFLSKLKLAKCCCAVILFCCSWLVAASLRLLISFSSISQNNLWCLASSWIFRAVCSRLIWSSILACSFCSSWVLHYSRSIRTSLWTLSLSSRPVRMFLRSSFSAWVLRISIRRSFLS